MRIGFGRIGRESESEPESKAKPQRKTLANPKIDRSGRPETVHVLVRTAPPLVYTIKELDISPPEPGPGDDNAVCIFLPLYLPVN